MSVVKGGYVPSDWQVRFHNAPVDEVLGAGSSGPGKTTALIHDADTQIIGEDFRTQLPEDDPDHIEKGLSRGWALYVRRTYQMLTPVVALAHQIFPKMDKGVKWNGEDHIFTFSSGYKFQFGHCFKPGDWERYQGFEFTRIMFDELTQFMEEQYEQIRGRLSTSDPFLAKQLRCSATSNPVMRMDAGDSFEIDDPHWVRKRFVDPAPGGGVILKTLLNPGEMEPEYGTRIYLPAKLEDNPDKEFIKTRRRTLMGLRPHIRRALLDGDWYFVIGSFYEDCWDPAVHVCRPFKIPRNWRRFRSMDWGLKQPGCIHWWAVSPDGDLFCEKEVKFQGMDAPKVAKMIRDCEQHMGLWSTKSGEGGYSLISGPADNQLWEDRGDRGLGKAKQMAAIGVKWQKADKRSRQNNFEHFSKRLRASGEGLGDPGICFFDTCQDIITHVTGIGTDPSNPECPKDGGDDHSHDSVGYACAFASRPNAGVVPELPRRSKGRPPTSQGYGYGS